MAQQTLRQKAGAVIGGVGALLPAMIVTGFLPQANIVPLPLWFAVSAACGAVGGALFVERRPGVGVLLGALTGMLCLLMTITYVQARATLSDSLYKFEFAIPLLLSPLPAWAIWRLLDGGPMSASARR